MNVGHTVSDLGFKLVPNMGDPKMKFLHLFLSAVRRPQSAHPSDHKKLLLTLSLSDIRPGANTLYRIDPTMRTWPAKLRATSDTILAARHCRTADGLKFLLLFRTAPQISERRYYVKCKKHSYKTWKICGNWKTHKNICRELWMCQLWMHCGPFLLEKKWNWRIHISWLWSDQSMNSLRKNQASKHKRHCYLLALKGSLT